MGGELGAKAFAGVLHAPVGVQQQAGGTPAAMTLDGHQQGGDDEVRGQGGGEGPA